MVSIDDNTYWCDLKKKVENNRDSQNFRKYILDKIPRKISDSIFQSNLKNDAEIDFFNYEPEDCKYQQKIAEGLIRYYPFRISQCLSIIALLAAVSLSYFKDIFIKILIISILFLVMIIILDYIESRFTKLQVLIENAERRIQYDNITTKRRQKIK
jgi:hypothetical protein